MLDRRQFLAGLLSTIAAAAVTRNGVLRPSEEIAQPERRVFDMAANTWRIPAATWNEGLVTYWEHGHVNCRCVLPHPSALTAYAQAVMRLGPALFIPLDGSGAVYVEGKWYWS